MDNKVTVLDNYKVCVWILKHEGEQRLREYLRSLPEEESLAMENIEITKLDEVVQDE